MGLFGKKLGNYKTLERYKRTLDDFYMIGETEEYRLYLDKRLGQYILRQEKQNPKKVVYLGWLRGKYCIFHGKLFFMEKLSYTGRTQHPLNYIDIETANSGIMSILSDKGSWIAMHWHCQDVVKEFGVENDVLALKVLRYKENVHNEEEMTFFIHISCVDGEFKVDYTYPMTERHGGNAEEELQKFLEGGSKSELRLVEEWKNEGKTAEEILEFLKSF